LEVVRNSELKRSISKILIIIKTNSKNKGTNFQPQLSQFQLKILLESKALMRINLLSDQGQIV